MSDIQHEIETEQRVVVRTPAQPKLLTASYEATCTALRYHLPARGALLVERVLQLEETVRTLTEQVTFLREKMATRAVKPVSVQPEPERERFRRRESE